MNQSQRDLRRAAAQDFMRSLDQLEKHMTTPDPSDAAASKAEHLPGAAPPAPPSQPDPPLDSPITVQEWEEAVADIEQLLTGNSRF